MPRGDKKAYASVIARVPQDLVTAAKQYASQHRCSVSELLREGLEMRLDAEVPGRSHTSSSAPGGEVFQEVLHAVNALAPTLRAAVQGTVRETVKEVLHEVLRESTSEGVQGHTSASPPHAATQKGHTAVGQQNTLGRHHPAKVIQEVFPHDRTHAFDTTRFFAGELCPQGHDDTGTGQSLRYLRGDHDCVTCRQRRNERYNAQKREKRRQGEGG